MWEILNVKPHKIKEEEIETLDRMKKLLVETGHEDKANDIWRIKTILIIWDKYIRAYEMMKSKSSHLSAWDLLADIENDIYFLRNVFEFDDKYYINFIEDSVRNYQTLFPYKTFTSHEMIVKRKRCSICGSVRSIRKPCGHVTGQLYNGEMCFNIYDDFRYLAFALVSNPVDKFAVLQLQDMNYNYDIVNKFMDIIRDPFHYWSVEVVKKNNPKYKDVGRNDKCPCGSDKKYKHCCLKGKNNLLDHYIFHMSEEYSDKPLNGRMCIL